MIIMQTLFPGMKEQQIVLMYSILSFLQHKLSVWVNFGESCLGVLSPTFHVFEEYHQVTVLSPDILLPNIEQTFVNFSLIYFFVLLMYWLFVDVLWKKYSIVSTVLVSVLHLHFIYIYIVKHPQNLQWNTLFTVKIWAKSQLTWTMKQNNIGSEKLQVLVNIRT